ncbi:MAG: tetratricopeptide repeat protein [Saprospiraceae bacterium]|nr:tetratricopeptide repeat protein [Bacteroidia bacterium]NNE13983.1 tetratricopeptide repeat protein [Saprospiraceae bacterium]NNL92757.1 tetratricopeptide repeat protein [Saprospiraceae bacterium]
MLKFIKAPTAIILVVLCFVLSSCKNDGTSDNASLFKGQPQLININTEYTKSPNVATANKLLKEMTNIIGQNKLSDSELKAYLEYGLDVSSTQNITSRQAGFLMSLIKEDFGNKNTASRLFNLSSIMAKMKKTTVSNTLVKGLLKNFPNFEKADQAKALLTEDIQDVNEYVVSLGKKIFENPDNTGINRFASLAYVDACEAFALSHPKDANAPDYLFKAAEVAKSLRTFPKSLTLYDWIIEEYPDFEKAGTALFLKGFIIENNLGDDEKAREIYNEFLKKYPKHDLADDVQFLIENLGKSDEEILKMIESKQKENQ